MFVADTNILVYAANDRSTSHSQCRRLLDNWRVGSQAWFLTWGICYEFLRVVTHPRVLSPPWNSEKAWIFIESLMESSSLNILLPTDRHAAVLAQTLAETPSLVGNLWHDAHTAVLMREHGVRRIYTRDTDLHRFPFLEPLDPMKESI